MPSKKLFELRRIIKMSQNKVSEQNCDIKKGRGCVVCMYNLFKVGKFAKIAEYIYKIYNH